MTESKPEVKRIALGSGKLYVKEQTDDINTATGLKTFLTAIETEDNILGMVSGGATLEYKPTFITVRDDLGTVERTIMTEDEATLKGGICTWNGATLVRICSTARVTENATDGLRVAKIGGVKNYDGKKYAILFVNDDAEFGKSYILIVGNNQNGFELTFAKDKETVINPEFKALPSDSDGTKIIYVEEMKKAGA